MAKKKTLVRLDDTFYINPSTVTYVTSDRNQVWIHLDKQGPPILAPSSSIEAVIKILNQE